MFIKEINVGGYDACRSGQAGTVMLQQSDHLQEQKPKKICIYCGIYKERVVDFGFSFRGSLTFMKFATFNV